ncbi:MAG: ATP-binding cassette domain-containing protein, partial [Candidatus Aminicenantales bacterium]
QSVLSFVAEIKQIPGAQRREAVEKAIAVASLEPVRGRLIKNISRGFKQRVGIAQALIHDPQVLILDEPTIGLDPAQIIEIRQMIKSLKGERTIILSTHILAEVTQTCDGLVIINEGRLMASGSLEELTASLQDRDGVFLRLREGGQEKLEHFRNIPGILRAGMEDDGFTLEWTRGQDLRDTLAGLIVEKGWGLVEMRPLSMSIEDLYLRVISGGTEQ